MPSGLRDRRRRRDAYYRRAKDENYAARSVFKLEQLDRRFKLLRPGNRVLDLGCRPGSWLQYAATRVGPSGQLVGLDREPLQISLPPQVRIVVGDVLAIDAAELAGDVGEFDLILSDMAPNTCGVAFTDQTRSVELFLRALELARALGAPRNSFVAKVFMGAGFDEALLQVKQTYRRTRTVRPDATRKKSTEVYVVGQERRPT
jgi:23S rRNA (uridine2552-2'-O)-methyltransferase